VIQTERFKQVGVSSVTELHNWLKKHHAQEEGVWLVTYKKSVPEKYISTNEVLDELVAFGWTDGIRRKVDDEKTMQLISPRRTEPWAKSYKDRAERLIAEGRMQASGQASVDAAKKSGAWDAMNEVDALVMPPDLSEALAAQTPADTVFADFPPSIKRNILRWIASAKTDATRSKRIALTVSEAKAGRRVKSNG
jgi:uncharacterized protein YdeI (YjbR/CyaY-like superfamily)